MENKNIHKEKDNEKKSELKPKVLASFIETCGLVKFEEIIFNDWTFLQIISNFYGSKGVISNI